MGALSGGVPKRTVALAILASALGLMLACATSPPSESGWLGLVEDVRIDRDEEGRIITLVGLDSASYTSFTTADPSAVVVDLAGVRVGGTATRIPVYDGLIGQVSLSPFSKENGEMVTRVEVTTAQEVDFEIAESADGLVLRLWPRLAGSAGSESATAADSDEEDPWADPDLGPAAADPWAASLQEAQQGNEAWATLPAELSASSPAGELQGISIQVLDGGVLIHLIADGAIGVTERFSLTDPDRFVLDLPGLTTQLAGKNFPVDSLRVTQIRIGSHHDSVRVVIDGGPEAAAFAHRRIRPSRDGLFLGLGHGPELADAMSLGVRNADEAARRSLLAALAPPAPLLNDEAQAFEAVEPLPETGSDEWPISEQMVDTSALDEPEALELTEATEATEAIELIEWEEALEVAEAVESEEALEATEAIDTAERVRIFGVNYDSQDSVERVVVLADGVAEYELYTPDPETLVISLRNAVIVPGAAGRLRANPGASISLITSFQQPDIEGEEVRVVVKRAENLMPVVTQHGTMLFVDFPNGGAAAALPAAFDQLAMAGEPAPVAPREPEQVPAPNAQPAPTELAQAEATLAAELQAAPVDPVDPVDPWQGGPAESEPEDFADATPVPASDVPASRDAPASAAPPAAVEILQEGGLSDGKEYRGRRISLDFNNVPVEDVLRLIAEVSDLNMIAGDEVKGNITIRMMDVPWDQALDVVLLTKSLGFIRIGNVLRIAPSDVLKAEAEVRLQERRNLERLEDLIVKLQPLNYADVKDATALVSRLLSERGSVIADERTSTLIIKDIPTVVEEAVALLKAIDTQTPQVLIEAKIVEANLDFSRELGTEWSIATQPLVNGFDSGSGARTDLGGQDFRFHGNNNISFSNPINAIPTAAGSLSAFLLDEKLNLEVRLQAQESSGEGKVISSPRVVTMDNREAVIEQGVSIPFQTFEQGDAKLEFIDAVLSLKVTPHITADRSIIMKLEITRNAPDSSIPTTTGTTAIAKNAVKTETLVGDGQTLVLGGIYTISKTATYSQVPYLHRIPILGGAFKSKRVRDERKELLIFVTPRILADVANVAGG